MSKTFGNLFLSVGAMKAGTTWLYSALNRHPALHFSAEKELHYFYHKHIDSKLLSPSYRHDRAVQKYVPIMAGAQAKNDFAPSGLKQFVKKQFGRFLPKEPLELSALSKVDREWITHYLSDPVDDAWFNGLFPLAAGETYACEFSNLSAHLSADVWADLAARTENLKVLYTLRDPIKRLWSHTKFQLQITDQLHLLDSWTPEDFNTFVRQPSIWDNAEYGRVCSALMQSLPDEALRVQSYEDMNDDPVETLAQIERFLEVPAFTYPQWLMTRRPTQSASIPMPDFFPSLFADDVTRIKDELADLGLAMQDRWM